MTSKLKSRRCGLARLLVLGCALATVNAQTQIDLFRQSKGAVDFQAAPYTKPLKTGTALPGTCSVGELFYLSTAAAGANIYGCTSADTWTAQGSGAAGQLTVQINGTTVGSRNVWNLIPGAGIQSVVSDSGAALNVQHMVDPAVVMTRAGHQTGETVYCASSGNDASNYACELNPALPAYVAGMMLHWQPDVNAVDGALTLNVDNLGARSLKTADGTTDLSSQDVVAGRLYLLWYDGSQFRVLNSNPMTTAAFAPPACDAAVRGRIWHMFAAAGAKDQVSVCAKDNLDSYAWRTIY